MKLPSKGGDDASVRLEIVQAGSSIAGCQPYSFYEPHSEAGSEPTPTQLGGGGGGAAAVAAPEKKLTLFAFRLAMLEKSASGIGTLAFVWATVVLLGGFAITLENKDFIFVTVIIVTESARVFSRSHELEWQHESTWAVAAAAGERSSLRAIRSSSRFFLCALKAALHPLSVLQIERAEAGREHDRNSPTNDQGNVVRVVDRSRSWKLPDVPLLPYAGWVFVAKNTSRLLLWLQIASSAACIALSITRLVQHDYGEVASESKNRNKALILFYSLALAEAMIFLMEKAYWWWIISYRSLFKVVSRECFPGGSGGVDVAVTRFFYDAYSKCIAGSIFDGLKMDLVSFATELLASNLRDEQLIGARVLRSFARSYDFGFDTLRKIGTSNAVVERLVEMLSWKNPHPEEEELRRGAAEILTRLAGKRQTVLRVGTVPSAMVAISSLLGKQMDTTGDYATYDFPAFNLLGLSLLKKLAADNDNCWKISNTRGLLPKIIDLTRASRTLLANEQAPESQIKTAKRALKVVKMLAGTTGKPGIMLRQELSEIVFTVSNVREIIRYGERHRVLQTLAIEILKSLAIDGDAKEQIGRTGQVTSLLLAIFLKPSVTSEEKSLRNQAGETLSILALENKNNCNRIADEPEALSRLMEALAGGGEIQVNASRILRNLCAYGGGAGTGFRQRLQPLTAALPTVLKAIMATEGRLLEASLGLTKQICKLTTTPDEFSDALRRAGVEEAKLAEKLAAILREFASPDIKVPRMRRFAINQAIWMMKSNRNNIDQFKKLGMESLLESVAETTSELECFHIFSGSVGLSRQSKTTLSSRVQKALKLMRSEAIEV